LRYSTSTASRRPGVLGVLGVLVALAAACGSSHAPESGTKILTYEDSIAEYRTARTALTLAPGDTWNESPITLRKSDENGQPQFYEAGVGAQQADFQWYCSWARVATVGPSEQKPVALKTLSSFPSIGGALGAWANMDGNGHSMFTTNLASANLGDFSGLTAYVGSNCP
jgi:hypothetical protein